MHGHVHGIGAQVAPGPSVVAMEKAAALARAAAVRRQLLREAAGFAGEMDESADEMAAEWKADSPAKANPRRSPDFFVRGWEPGSGVNQVAPPGLSYWV